MAVTHGGVPFPTDRFIFNYLHQMFPGLPFYHKVPVTKLIHIIIERGFNEGEMFLTFECHSLLLPAVLWLLRDKATPLWITPSAFMRMLSHTACSLLFFLNEYPLFTVTSQFIGLYCIFSYHLLRKKTGFCINSHSCFTQPTCSFKSLFIHVWTKEHIN